MWKLTPGRVTWTTVHTVLSLWAGHPEDCVCVTHHLLHEVFHSLFSAGELTGSVGLYFTASPFTSETFASCVHFFLFLFFSIKPDVLAKQWLVGTEVMWSMRATIKKKTSSSNAVIFKTNQWQTPYGTLQPVILNTSLLLGSIAVI